MFKLPTSEKGHGSPVTVIYLHALIGIKSIRSKFVQTSIHGSYIEYRSQSLGQAVLQSVRPLRY